MVQDGGFEAGTPSTVWDEGSTHFGSPLCTVASCTSGGGTGPHGGDWWAWFGGFKGGGETGFVAQEVTIPAADIAKLRFWLEIPAAGNPGVLDVSLGGDILFSVTEADAGDFPFYAEVVLDVTEYAVGVPYELRFEGTTQTGPTVTNFFVDDVSLTVHAGPFIASGLEVDPPGTAPGANDVFEPGESVVVAPAWRYLGEHSASLSGTALSFTGPEEAAYDIDLGAASYGLLGPGDTASCLDTGVCYRLSLDDPATRPAAHWDAEFVERLNDVGFTTINWPVHIGDSFTDVPRSNLFYTGIENLLHSGVTGGCADGSTYCPGDANTRSQMPAFMLRALGGPDYTPPPCDEGEERLFDDVPASNLFCPWIEELAGRGIVSGCSDNDYCPSAAVTRAQMAIFLLKTRMGAGYEPPACTGVFTDVPCPSLFADWIEDLAGRGITQGCSPTEYCPTDAVTRGQMAAFITKTFGFNLYGHLVSGLLVAPRSRKSGFRECTHSTPGLEARWTPESDSRSSLPPRGRRARRLC